MLLYIRRRLKAEPQVLSIGIVTMIKIYPNYEPIPGYKTVEKLGEGGFGEVWKAIVPGGLFKAIKFVNTKQGLQKASQEWQAIDRIKTIRHPFILSLDRVDVLPDTLVVVMELADKNLWTKFHECKAEGLPGIPRPDVIKYLLEAAEALDLIHNQYQLQHLDIKPHNLFLVQNHLKIGDFGLVQELNLSGKDYHGAITPVYSSPELIEGWPSKFSDQYSLAIVYQEMVTGKRPFTAENLRKLIHQHLNEAPDLLSLEIREQPIMLKALEKVPENRFSSCTEFMETLASVHQGQPKVILHPELPKLPKTETVLNAPEAVPLSQELSKTVNFRKDALSPSATKPETQKASADSTKADTRYPIAKPTAVLFIGLGKTGLETVGIWRARSKREIETQFPDFQADAIGVDMDSQSLQSGNPANKLPPERLVICPLNRPNYYMRDREKMEAFKSWLPLNKLYQIPKDLTTGSSRALGRLAFLDSLETAKTAIRQEIMRLWNKGSLASFGKSLRPEFVLASHASGGASGATGDLLTLIENICEELDLLAPRFHLVFYMPDFTRCSLKEKANAGACLLEMKKVLESKSIRGQAARSAISGIQLVPFLSQSTEEREHSVEKAGAFLASKIHDRLQDKVQCNQFFKPASLEGSRLIATVGTQVESCQEGPAESEQAFREAIRLINSWSTLTPSKKVDLNLWVERELVSQGFTPASLHDGLKASLDKALGKPVESFFLKDLLEKLYSLPSNSTGSEIEKIARDILTQATSQLGPLCKVIEATPERGLFWKMLQPCYLEMVEHLNVTLDSWMVKWIEMPGFRFAGARELTRLLAFKFKSQNAAAALEESKSIAEAGVHQAKTEALLSSFRGGTEQGEKSVQKLLESLKGFLKYHLTGILNQFVSRIYKTLEQQLSEHNREIEFCQSRIHLVLERIQRGAGSASSAPAHIPDHHDLESLALLDEELQKQIKENLVALTQACISSEHLLLELEKLILHVCQEHLQAYGKLSFGSATVFAMDGLQRKEYLNQVVLKGRKDDSLAAPDMPSETLVVIPKKLFGEWNKLRLDGPPTKAINLVAGETDKVLAVHQTFMDDLTSLPGFEDLQEALRMAPSGIGVTSFSRDDVTYQ